jgi:hypothetical protein
VGLNTIIQNNTNSPLKEKAATMIDVLKRRKEIETYLTNLQVTRAEEEQILVQNDKPVVKTQTPVTTVPAVITKPAVTVPVIKDTLPKAPPLVTNGIFIIKPDSPHHVIMILEKVDPVYVNESKNAFTRYNNQNYYGQPITISKESIDADHNILVISSFPDGAAALQYYEKIKRDASREVSWLPANKYSFVIISNDNLQLLKANKDITGYRTLLNKQYPGKF